MLGVCFPPCQQQSKFRCFSSFCHTFFTITLGGLQQLFFCVKAQRCCFTATLRTPPGLLGTGRPGRPPRLAHNSLALSRLFSSVLRYVHRNRQAYLGWGAQDGHLNFRFKSSDTIRLIRDGEARTATSTFTQLLSSACYTRPLCLHSAW